MRRKLETFRKSSVQARTNSNHFSTKLKEQWFEVHGASWPNLIVSCAAVQHIQVNTKVFYVRSIDTFASFLLTLVEGFLSLPKVATNLIPWCSCRMMHALLLLSRQRMKISRGFQRFPRQLSSIFSDTDANESVLSHTLKDLSRYLRSLFFFFFFFFFSSVTARRPLMRMSSIRIQTADINYFVPRHSHRALWISRR